MSDHDEKQLNNPDAELTELRSLVGDAQGDDLSLDDILAEYSERSRPKEVVTLSDEDDGEENLLVFPTSNRPPDPDLIDDEPEDEPADESEEDEADPLYEAPVEDTDEVVREDEGDEEETSPPPQTMCWSSQPRKAPSPVCCKPCPARRTITPSKCLSKRTCPPATRYAV